MHLIRLQFEICTIMREYKFVTHFSHKRLPLEDSVTCLTKIGRSLVLHGLINGKISMFTPLSAGIAAELGGEDSVTSAFTSRMCRLS